MVLSDNILWNICIKFLTTIFHKVYLLLCLKKLYTYLELETSAVNTFTSFLFIGNLKAVCNVCPKISKTAYVSAT